MAEARMTAYTEFGVPGISNIDVLKSFIPNQELFPPREGTTWSTHHGFGAWRKSSWTEMETFRKYFGEPQSLEELVKYSQLLQCEGLKFIYEEARRQKPYSSMALNWCFQEPWPTAANNSLINWPNEIKPAYYHVANACRPVLASVRLPKFVWQENEDFALDLFLLNDSYDRTEKVKITVVLQYDDREMELLTWNCPGAEPFRNAQGPTLHFRMPPMKSNLFTVRVKVDKHPEYESVYKLLYKGEDTGRELPSKDYYEGIN
jgi:beta-mannosidase